ncbi:MAG: alanine--tRNA ligase [Acholeplasmataceae bacterium]
MKTFTAKEIRHTWLRFFESKGHLIEPSSSLIPNNDPTLLWINAGVAPLKKYFDGTEKPPKPRLTNVQKCIRTNDIDNVGRTARHHTFFEMLGNFSIGDYFKDEAIEYALELLTSNEYFGIDKEKLYMTYYPSDTDAYEKWKSLGIKEEHLIPLEGNFWEIGPGPCGPDTEIFFDRGPEFDDRGVELLQHDIDNERYVEIWNVVFSQFNSIEDLERSEYPELPQQNIDTGAGLERWACILQQTPTNFETDLFLPIIKAIETSSKVTYDGQMAFKVIADHIKALTFAIADGAMLSNEGRGYVLRRLLRRAVKYGLKLGFEKPFLHELVQVVVSMMSDFYPVIKDNQTIVEKVVFAEEEKFFETIADGEKLLEQALKETDKTLSGDVAFKLYDTYGFPFELTEEYALEKGYQVDKLGFDQALKEQKERSRNAIKDMGVMNQQEEVYLSFDLESKFIGYDTLETQAKVIAVFDEGIVLDQTPFYAESGGQLSDLGNIDEINVIKVKRLPNKQHLHMLDDHHFEMGQTVHAKVDHSSRAQVEKNHSAAHLFHQAIKDIYGSHCHQQGQQVSQTSWRFDFNHFETVSEQDILKVEALVNHYIKDNPLDVSIYETTIDEAKSRGAMALFGEKYGDIVRVVDMNWSIELCGGTHVKNTSDIVSFAITNYTSIGSGIYRMEGITGESIESSMKPYLNSYTNELNQLKQKIVQENLQVNIHNPGIKGSYQDIINYRQAIQTLKSEMKDAEKKKLESLEKDVLSYIDFEDIDLNQSIQIIKVSDVPKKVLKSLVDQAFDQLTCDVLILINIDDSKAAYLVKSKLDDAHVWIKKLNDLTEGSGGGRPNFAQGGTTQLSILDRAIGKLV